MGVPHLRVVDESFVPEKPAQIDELIKELSELNTAINAKRQGNRPPIAFDALMNELTGFDYNSFVPAKPTQADELFKELSELNKTVNVKRRVNRNPIAFDSLMNELSGFDRVIQFAPRQPPKVRPAKKIFVIPNETELLRNRHGNEILSSYIKKITGCTRVKLKEIFYNKDYRLSVEARIS
ncbi:MAG TPA: hypothetical protein DHV36_17935 [Desulfobacteraceae bacterium]|nr:hypothetical protein [Desulfobacteraceae bacterium]